MHYSMHERIEYGRVIRDRARCLFEAHGSRAELEAREAAVQPGIGVAEQCFWEAVGDRAARLVSAARRSGS